MFATGSLIRTLIPRRRARKWTSVISLNNSSSSDASGNNTAPTTRGIINIAGPDVFIESNYVSRSSRGIANPSDDADGQQSNTCTSTSLLPAQKLSWEVHAVCFTCSDVAAPMATVKSVLSGAFAGVKLHEYPYGADTWPANLIVNMRDAAIVTEQFPEVYKPEDVLLFTSISPPQAASEGVGFTLAGHNLSCIAECKAKGAASSLFKKHAAVAPDATVEADGDPAEAAGDDSNACPDETPLPSAPWMYTIAVSCRVMKQVSEDILRLIKEDEQRSDAATAESRDQLFLRIVEAIQACTASSSDS